MGTMKKYIRPVKSVISGQNMSSGSGSRMDKYSSWLNEYYEGPPDRMMRYQHYDQMDYDSEVHQALNIISEFSTQLDDETKVPFTFHYYDDDVVDSTLDVLQEALIKWAKINQFEKRIFNMFRNTIKFGDQFFIRDPETFKLIWVSHENVEKVFVDESDGKKPTVYYIRNLDPNFETMTATAQDTTFPSSYDSTFPRVPTTGQGHTQAKGATPPMPVDATHVIHLSLSDGMDIGWPFGKSELEKIYKTYKQKELLEDAVLIYRVHRAPERRVFYIDTGEMPPAKAAQYLERVRLEVQQKRIPSRTGGGDNILSSDYNPLCLDLETRIPLLDGRTLSLKELIVEFEKGNENWTYSCDPITGKVVPGPISWAGQTKSNAECIKITLDNGKEIICTPDHKIPVLGKGFVEAQNLTTSDPLISFEKSRGADRLDISILSIESVANRDVGTLTIDVDEVYHNHHTYATEAGIFVMNSMMEDYFFSVGQDGRGSRVDPLPGGQNLGDIDDLRYFDLKMIRGMGIPASYLPTGSEDSTREYTDGRVGNIMVQEVRFHNYCERLQRHLISYFDKEFKLYLKQIGINVDSGSFALRFVSPLSFSEYREIELNSSRASLYSQLSDNPYISKRFALSKYMGLTETEIAENERLWKEEKGKNNDDAILSGSDFAAAGAGTPNDFGSFDEPEFDDEDMGDVDDVDMDADMDDADADMEPDENEGE